MLNMFSLSSGIADILKTIAAFAAAYALLSQNHTLQFSVNNKIRALTVPEAVYFSIITQTTLGYGDVVPMNTAARALVSFQAMTTIAFVLDAKAI